MSQPNFSFFNNQQNINDSDKIWKVCLLNPDLYIMLFIRLFNKRTNSIILPCMGLRISSSWHSRLDRWLRTCVVKSTPKARSEGDSLATLEIVKLLTSHVVPKYNYGQRKSDPLRTKSYRSLLLRGIINHLQQRGCSLNYRGGRKSFKIYLL